MIDTDKYEGHIAPDRELHDYQVWSWSNWMLKHASSTDEMNATANLLNDAPLILEAYKEICEGIELMAEYMVAYHEVFPRIKGMAKELKELIE